MERIPLQPSQITLVVVAILACWNTANAAVTVLGVQYQPDNAYPEFNCIWHDKNYPTSCSGTIVGANVHVYLRNDDASSVTVNDVTLAGYSLATVIKRNSTYHESNSIYYYWDNPPQAIIDAGEPVWYKADPSTIPAGGVAQVVVRLRFVPVTQPVSLGVVTSVGTVNATIPVDANAAQLASVGFSSDRTKVYLHWRRSGGAAPVTIKMDGNDVTASSTTVDDASVNFAASVLTLGTPLTYMSYHVFQGVYADSKTATGSLRAWSHPFLHASWSTFPCPDQDTACGQAFVDDSLNRGFNAVQNQLDGGGVADFLGSNAGKAYIAAHGYGLIVWNTSTSDNPLLSFIDDEPDAEEDNVSKNFCGTGLKLNCGASPMGILAMRFIESGEAYRALYPNAPTTINMNGTFKPENYYAYGQAFDVLQVDPYYQKRLKDTYWYHNPEWIPLYNKATYNYAVAQAVTTAAEPNPSHVILLSTESRETVGGVQKTWPFPTPQAKRIEVYYSLAGGAKGISYWWFKPGYPSNGLGAQTPEALALWKEMGLYGNEIKTISPLLVTSHPVAMTLAPSTNVWARALASGTDTIILLVVNDNYYNDEAGFHSTPVSNAMVTATLPSWMQASPTAFEISPSGLSDVTTQLNGSQLQLNLGTLNITRMIVITTNPQLRTTIQQRYDLEVRPGICAFAPEFCNINSPTITLHPQPSSVCTAGSTLFTVTATGSGTLTYQWQKNNSNLSNGGHYSGCTTPTLTVSSVDNTDAANYRCVVSNPYGSVNSNQAALTVLACNPNCLTNLGFEQGFTSGIGNGWTKFLKVGDVTLSDETTERHGGSHSQEVYSPNKNNDGGVYQRFLATPGQPYTVKAWIKVHSPEQPNNAEGFFGIDPTGGTDSNSAQIMWASKPWEYWSQDTWTVTAQSNYITVYLRGRSTRLNQTAYVWLDDIELAPGAPTDSAPQAVSPTSIRWKWIDLFIETGYRVRDASNVDKSGVLAADTTQWTETTGITANTQYTRHISARNDCGESDPSTGQTTYSLIETPADVTFGTITTTSIVASPVGTLSNLATGSSGVRVSNTTAGTNSGWQTTTGSWTSSGLAANTPYEFVARARNANSVETPDCIPETVWTLSAPPTAGSVTSGSLAVCVDGDVEWTSDGGFGAGTVQYYRFAWDQSPTHNWSGLEPQWQSGTLMTSPTAAGAWYLHVQGYNGSDIANGTYDYAFAAGQTIAPDHDGDCDVDGDDFTLIKSCLSRAETPYTGGCAWADFDQDGDADLFDFSVFQRCYSGEAIPAVMNCAN